MVAPWYGGLRQIIPVACLLGAAASGGADSGAEMRGRHDHRHPPRHVLEDGPSQQLALVVREDELLRKVRQDADPVGAGIDHEVDATLLAVEIQLAALDR